MPIDRIRGEPSGFRRCRYFLLQIAGDVWNGPTTLWADTPQELDFLDQCIQELQEHDPDSMSFRYPCDKTGDQHLQNLSHINVRHLMETMERTANLLSCITIDLSERLRWKVEMEQDARP